MIVIWKGWGIAVLGLLILSGAIFAFGAIAILGQDRADQVKDWLNGPACLLAAAMVFFLGRYFDRQPGRVVIDKASGQEFTVRRTHSLFFIKVSHWAPILAIAGVVLLGMKAFGQ